MPTRDRFGVTHYKDDEDLPPRKWYMERSRAYDGYEDIPYLLLGARLVLVLAVLAVIVFSMIQIGAWWDNNTYGYRDCVTDRMADYHAQYGQAGEGFRDKVEDDCFDEYNR